MDMVLIPADELQRMIDESISKHLKKFQPATRELKFFSVAEVAKKLKCAPLTIYRGCKAGRIPHKMVGNLIKIPSNYLE